MQWFVKLSIQKWYAPKIHNRELLKICSDKKWLHVSVNGKPIRKNDMLPFFKMVQEMYTTALAKTYKTEYTAEVNYEISTRPVNIHNYFEEGSTAGYVAVSKISKQQLYADVMSLSPYVYCGRFEAEGGLNEPMVMYTRDPGMVIEYCVSGEWVKGITWPESEDDFIFAFFVPDTQKILKINLDVKEHAGKKLREYLRSCEASDHMGWSDPAKMFIVARIRKNTVNQIMKLQNGNEEKRVDATASRLSGKLGKLLMPRIGYEKKKNSGGQGGGGGQGGSGGSSRNLTYEFSDFKFKGNDLEIQYCIKMTHSKRDTNIELVIESEGGRIDPISWQRDIGTPYPAMISSVSIDTLMVAGAKDCEEICVCTSSDSEHIGKKIEIKMEKADTCSEFTSFAIKSHVLAPEIRGILKIHARDKRYSFSFKVV